MNGSNPFSEEAQESYEARVRDYRESLEALRLKLDKEFSENPGEMLDKG